jgi:hypothetical protein
MVEVGPVRRKRHQPAFLFEDGAVRPRDQRQRARRIRPASLSIEHTFTLKVASDTFRKKSTGSRDFDAMAERT